MRWATWAWVGAVGVGGEDMVMNEWSGLVCVCMRWFRTFFF